MNEVDSQPRSFAFSLGTLFVVLAAVGIGVAVSLAGPSGRTPMLIPWLALCAPAYSLISLLVLVIGENASPTWQVLFSVVNGVLFGGYALLALLPTRWPLVVALVVHAGSILLGLGLMMMNC